MTDDDIVYGSTLLAEINSYYASVLLAALRVLRLYRLSDISPHGLQDSPDISPPRCKDSAKTVRKLKTHTKRCYCMYFENVSV